MLAVTPRVSQGMFPSALLFQRAIPDQIQDPSAGGGSVRSVVVAICVMTAAASHWLDRTIRRVVQYGSFEAVRPQALDRALSPDRGSSDHEPAEHQKVLCLGTAKVPLARVQHLNILRGMHVRSHMCRAPVRVGMLAASSIHRSASFFQEFSRQKAHPPASHPSLLSKYELIIRVNGVPSLMKAVPTARTGQQAMPTKPRHDVVSG